MSPQDVVLLVEDNEEDVILLRRAFLRARVLNPLLVVRDGEEAIYYLEGSGRYANRMEFPSPSVVLLDLNLPGIGGFDVLRWVRNQPGLRKLRVVVLRPRIEFQTSTRRTNSEPVPFWSNLRISTA